MTGNRTITINSIIEREPYQRLRSRLVLEGKTFKQWLEERIGDALADDAKRPAKKKDS